MIVMVYIICTAALGLVIAYGAWQYHTRDRRKDALTEQATKALYDSYERDGGREPDPRT